MITFEDLKRVSESISSPPIEQSEYRIMFNHAVHPSNIVSSRKLIIVNPQTEIESIFSKQGYYDIALDVLKHRLHYKIDNAETRTIRFNRLHYKSFVIS